MASSAPAAASSGRDARQYPGRACAAACAQARNAINRAHSEPEVKDVEIVFQYRRRKERALRGSEFAAIFAFKAQRIFQARSSSHSATHAGNRGTEPRSAPNAHHRAKPGKNGPHTNWASTITQFARRATRPASEPAPHNHASRPAQRPLRPRRLGSAQNSPGSSLDRSPVTRRSANRCAPTGPKPWHLTASQPDRRTVEGKARW